MEPATWVIGTVVALALLHLLLLGLLSRRRNADSLPVGGDGSDDSGASAVEEGTRDDPDAVRCRECGAENERGYRYCRHCVAELPGAASVQRTGATPIGGVN